MKKKAYVAPETEMRIVELEQGFMNASVVDKEEENSHVKAADQKRILDALGLRKLNRVVEHECTPSILGMVNKVKHLVAIVK